MNVSELLDSAIEEINRVLIGNKDRNTEEVYLKNAIRYIREYGSQPQLNDNQQIVLDKLKKNIVWGCDGPFVAIYNFIQRRECPNIILTYEEETQVLAAFAEWALEQEEE